MAISKEVYKALESIVGSKYISDDPAICQSYHGRGYSRETVTWAGRAERPACVIQPATTEEVQRIVKLCYRYKIPYTPASTLWVIWATPRVPDSLLIDLKRMMGLEIDDKNMYAIVEPGVIYAHLQEEAMNRGLYTLVGGGGAQASVLANHLLFSTSPLIYRVGMAQRRILGVEWVLPTGELLRVGSLALRDGDYFWGDGIGPNLQSMVRGMVGWYGGNGVVTRIAVKLFPFQTEKLEKIGMGPHSALQFPTDRMRWYNFQMPNREALEEAMYEISRSNIVAAMTKVPLFWRSIAKAEDAEGFWEDWDKVTEEEVANTHILRILVIGYTSAKQLEYEDRVLGDIMNEFGGKLRRTRQTDESWIKNADSACMWMMTGSFASSCSQIDSIDSCVRSGEALAVVKDKYTPPLMPDRRDPGWFLASDFGHQGYLEFLTYWNPRTMDPASPDYNEEDLRKGLEWQVNGVAQVCKETGCYNYFRGVMSSADVLVEDYWGPNYTSWMTKWKQVFDPENLANPPAPRENDELIKMGWVSGKKP